MHVMVVAMMAHDKWTADFDMQSICNQYVVVMIAHDKRTADFDTPPDVPAAKHAAGHTQLSGKSRGEDSHGRGRPAGSGSETRGEARAVAALIGMKCVQRAEQT